MDRIHRTYERIQKCIQSFNGKISLGRPKRRWEIIIKIDLRKYVVMIGTGWTMLKIGIMTCLWKGGNEPTGSLKVN